MKMQLEKKGYVITYNDPKKFEKAKKLQSLVEEIIKHHHKAKQALGRWLEHVRDCGEALLRAKKLFKKKRGPVLTWWRFVESHLDGLSIETAQDYMIVAREWENPRIVEARNNGVEIDSIRKFMELLKPPKPAADYNGDFTLPPEMQDDTVEREIDKEEAETERKAICKKFKDELDALHDLEVLILWGVFNDLWDRLYASLKDEVRKHFKSKGYNYDLYTKNPPEHLEHIKQITKAVLHRREKKAVA